jgi:hypothetical protein
VAIPTTAPLTGGWWLKRLADKLAERRAHYSLLQSYLDGTQNVPVASTKAVREAYQRLMSMSRMCWAELIVDAVQDRVEPLGFRTGAVADELGDQLAWRYWQSNSLDADCSIVHGYALGLGMGYAMVGAPDEELGGVPLVTPEDPREVIVEHDPAYRRKARAALKLYFDDVAGQWAAMLFLPGTVRRAVGPAGQNRENTRPNEQVWSDWEWAGPPEDLPASARSVVPVVAFPNRMRGGRAMAEFERHLGLLDRISYQVLQQLEIATMQAFKQRAIKGVPQRDPETGEKIDYDDIFAADPGALWVIPATAELWESGAVDLTPIRMARRDDVQDLAAATRTPLFYLTPDANNGSAEGASLAREGLVFKTRDRLRQFGESWEQVMALAFQFAGDEQRAKRVDMEIIWADPERYSLAERYDAAIKAQSAGVPFGTIMRRVLQFSPQEVDRMMTERVADAMQLASFAPPTLTVTAGQPPAGAPRALGPAPVPAAGPAEQGPTVTNG